jgi:hypothetical protein
MNKALREACIENVARGSRWLLARQKVVASVHVRAPCRAQEVWASGRGRVPPHVEASLPGLDCAAALRHGGIRRMRADMPAVAWAAGRGQNAVFSAQRGHLAPTRVLLACGSGRSSLLQGLVSDLSGWVADGPPTSGFHPIRGMSGVALGLACSPGSKTEGKIFMSVDTEVLASRNAGAARQAVLEFVERTASDGMPVKEPVAVFDNDGTLWCEKPMPIQADFILRRLFEMVRPIPICAGASRGRRPMSATTAGWARCLLSTTRATKLMCERSWGGVLAAYAGITVEEFEARSDASFAPLSIPRSVARILSAGTRR